MENSDLYIVIGLGGLFLLIGLGAILWGRSEKENYYKAISSRHDLREYMQQTPEVPEPVGLKTGGFLFIIVGLFLLIMGGILLLLQ